MRFNSHAVIGQNGTGKSNLLEAIITIFRDLDFGPREKEYVDFSYEIVYEVQGHTIRVKSESDRDR